ncbi:MAG: UDP-N-acetylmuramate--alanine ligase, partial [Alphaproteobacteria bacterium]|nr:UDP-N-acetylmuramate--alanine ligase [Alphaproteobacteria bacterium]
MATFFFCGIGGIGMSAIALYLKKAGHTVLGSDRSFDNNKPNAVKSNLCNNHIRLVPQTGEYVTKDIDFLIVSSAVEPTIPDVKKALELNIKIIKRAEILAKIFHKHTGIAIAGT